MAQPELGTARGTTTQTTPPSSSVQGFVQAPAEAMRLRVDCLSVDGALPAPFGVGTLEFAASCLCLVVRADLHSIEQGKRQAPLEASQPLQDIGSERTARHRNDALNLVHSRATLCAIRYQSAHRRERKCC